MSLAIQRGFPIEQVLTKGNLKHILAKGSQS